MPTYGHTSGWVHHITPLRPAEGGRLRDPIRGGARLPECKPMFGNAADIIKGFRPFGVDRLHKCCGPPLLSETHRTRRRKYRPQIGYTGLDGLGAVTRRR